MCGEMVICKDKFSAFYSKGVILMNLNEEGCMRSMQ
jgi:hypothetical protein